MSFSEFIRDNMESILQACEESARTILPPDDFSPEQLRNDFKLVLGAIIGEMEQRQSEHESSERSLGRGSPSARTSAEDHGSQRFSLGADVLQLATEFRAMRRSVIQLWVEGDRPVSSRDFSDLIQFDEALDKALSESIRFFQADKEHQERLLETMMSSLPDPCFVLDREGRFLYANEAMAALHDMSRQQITGRAFTGLCLPEASGHSQTLARVFAEKEKLREEVVMHSAAGRRYLDYVFAPVLDREGQVEAISGAARDITERKQSEEQVWHQANFDALTNIPNRRLFQDRLDQHAAHSGRTGAPFALLLIDLDHFKEVNDRLGHEAGDRLLQQAAARIESCIRETDTVARIGGDEFTVLLLDLGDEGPIREFVTGILDKLGAPFDLDGESAMVSASIGVSVFPSDTPECKQLLKQADRAMYLAKGAGRNRLCFFHEIS